MAIHINNDFSKTDIAAGKYPLINEDQNSKGFTQSGKPVTPVKYEQSIVTGAEKYEVNTGGTRIGDANWTTFTHTPNGVADNPRFTQKLSNTWANIGYMGEVNLSSTPLQIDVDTSGIPSNGSAGTLKYTISNINNVIKKISNTTQPTGPRTVKIDTWFEVPSDGFGNKAPNSSPGEKIYYEMSGISNTVTQPIGRAYDNPQTTVIVKAYTDSTSANPLPNTLEGNYQITASNYTTNTYSWVFDIPANNGTLTKSTYTYGLDKSNINVDTVTATIKDPQKITEPGPRTIKMGWDHNLTTVGEFIQVDQPDYSINFTTKTVSQPQAPIEAPKYEWSHTFPRACTFTPSTSYSTTYNCYYASATLTPSSTCVWTPTLTYMSPITTAGNGNSRTLSITYNTADPTGTGTNDGRTYTNGAWGPYNISCKSSNYNGDGSVSGIGTFTQTITAHNSGNRYVNCTWTWNLKSNGLQSGENPIYGGANHTTNSCTYTVTLPSKTLGVSYSWSSTLSTQTIAHINAGYPVVVGSVVPNIVQEQNRGGTCTWDVTCAISSISGSESKTTTVSITRADTGSTVSKSFTATSSNTAWSVSINSSGEITVTPPSTTKDICINGSSTTITVKCTISVNPTPTDSDKQGGVLTTSFICNLSGASEWEAHVV